MTYTFRLLTPYYLYVPSLLLSLSPLANVHPNVCKTLYYYVCIDNFRHKFKHLTLIYIFFTLLCIFKLFSRAYLNMLFVVIYYLHMYMCFFVVQSYVCIQFVDFFIVYANIYDHIYIYTTSCLHTIFAICTVVQYINASCWYKFLVYIFSSFNTPFIIYVAFLLLSLSS